MQTTRLTVFVFTIAGLLVISRPVAGQEEGVGFSSDELLNKSAVVARVGPLKITAEEFRLSYEFGPAFAKRASDARQRYLGYMINEKLLALDAAARRRQVIPLIEPALAEIEGDLATEELYKDDVQSKVKVSGVEIAAGIEQSKRHLTLQWIFALSQNEINSHAVMLRSGASFDSLYRLQGPDSLLAANRLLESSVFKIRMKNGEIGTVADTLKPGSSSEPLKGPDGWYILHVVDGSRDLITTQSDEGKLHNDVYRALLQQKSDSVSQDYVNALLTRHQPTIVPGTFDLLSSYLALKHLDPEEIREWELIGPKGSTRDSASLEAIEELAKETLVTLSGGSKIPLQDFLTWYRNRETLIKVRKSSKQAYLVSLQQMIWQMVRDRLLVQRARERNLQARESVRTQKKWWEEKLLYEAEKKLIVGSISFQDSMLLAYFGENRRRYMDARGAPATFSDARDDVLRDFYEYELTKRILHRINALKEKYPVAIDDGVLARIPVEGDPTAVEVYTVKKGGTFPRPAFPVIDQMWRTWN